MFKRLLMVVTTWMLAMNACSTFAQSMESIPIGESIVEASHLSEQGGIVEGAIEDLGPAGGSTIVSHNTDCNFCNTVCGYEESCSQCRKIGPLGKLKNGIHNMAYNGDDNSACGQYPCADCYSKWDIEKRIIVSYVAGSAMKRNTRLSVNDLDGAQVGAEFLPWVIKDGSSVFTRGGFTIMWQYSRFLGGSHEGQLRSNAGNFAMIPDGDMHSFIIGPTWRWDFDFIGVRLSPNWTIGGTFDWVDLNRQQGIPTGGFQQLPTFNFTGFDVGFYNRIMFDIGITEKLNFSIGMDFRASGTDVMQDDSLRKHFGFVIGCSHTF